MPLDPLLDRLTGRDLAVLIECLSGTAPACVHRIRRAELAQRFAAALRSDPAYAGNAAYAPALALAGRMVDALPGWAAHTAPASWSDDLTARIVRRKCLLGTD